MDKMKGKERKGKRRKEQWCRQGGGDLVLPILQTRHKHALYRCKKTFKNFLKTVKT